MKKLNSVAPKDLDGSKMEDYEIVVHSRFAAVTLSFLLNCGMPVSWVPRTWKVGSKITDNYEGK